MRIFFIASTLGVAVAVVLNADPTPIHELSESPMGHDLWMTEDPVRGPFLSIDQRALQEYKDQFDSSSWESTRPREVPQPVQNFGHRHDFTPLDPKFNMEFQLMLDTIQDVSGWHRGEAKWYPVEDPPQVQISVRTGLFTHSAIGYVKVRKADARHVQGHRTAYQAREFINANFDSRTRGKGLLKGGARYGNLQQSLWTFLMTCGHVTYIEEAGRVIGGTITQVQLDELIAELTERRNAIAENLPEFRIRRQFVRILPESVVVQVLQYAKRKWAEKEQLAGGVDLQQLTVRRFMQLLLGYHLDEDGDLGRAMAKRAAAKGENEWVAGWLDDLTEPPPNVLDLEALKAGAKDYVEDEWTRRGGALARVRYSDESRGNQPGKLRTGAVQRGNDEYVEEGAGLFGSTQKFRQRLDKITIWTDLAHRKMVENAQWKVNLLDGAWYLTA